MIPLQYNIIPEGAGLYEIMLSQKHLWIMEGSIQHENEPDCFAGISHSSCFIFTGGRGYGKHTMINAFAVSACTENEYTYFEIPCADFFAEKTTPLETIDDFFKQLDAYVKYSYEGGKYFVSFDGAEIFLKYPTLSARFMKHIIKFMNTDKAHMIIAICCECDTSELPSVFLKGTHVISLSLPNDEKRSDLFNDKLGTVSVACGFDINELVKCTDGFTYGELVRFSEELLMLIKGKYLYDNDLVDFTDKSIVFEEEFIQPAFIQTLCDDIRNSAPTKRSTSAADGFSMAEAFSELMRFSGIVSGVPMPNEHTVISEKQSASSFDQISMDLIKDDEAQQVKDSLNNAYNIEEAEKLMLP